MEEIIVNKLIENNETISSMESCTAGYFATTITNVSGSSEVLRFSAITYSNEYKIKFNVNEETINKYSVYSSEVAREMAYQISLFSNSTYGVGITGQIGRVDPANPGKRVNLIYACIYNSKTCEYKDIEIVCENESRLQCKKYIVDVVNNELVNVINNSLVKSKKLGEMYV